MGWDGNHARQDNQMTDKTNFKFYETGFLKKKKKKKKKKEQQRSDGKTKMR
jgi:hypothetical protein